MAASDRTGAGADRDGSIAIVLQDFALGGTERIALRLALEWHARGRAVTIICGMAEGALAPLVADAELRVIATGIARGRGSVRRLGRAAAAALAREPAATCFIPGNYHWAAIPPIARLGRARRPHIVAQVSAAIRKPQRRGWRDLAWRARMRWLLRRADAMTVLSRAARDDVARILPRAAVHVLPLPALPDHPEPPRPAAGAIVMGAGRLVPEKGFADLIAAFARLDRPGARLRIVGEGPDRARLEALAARLGVSAQIELPGYAPDIRRALDAARLFVLSSHFEGYPAVLIEALAAGRPVVATDCTPATAELLASPSRGETVPIGDVEAMARAMAAMLDRPPPDPAELAAAVARHRIGPVAEAYLAVFDGVAAG